MSLLVVLFALTFGVLLIVFGSITLWKWMELRESGSSRLQRRVEQLETEVAQLKDQVAEAVIEADERQWSRLAPAETPTISTDG